MAAVVRILDEARRRSDQMRRRLGEELRQARLQAGLSQAVVARAVGCSSSTISRIEHGLVRSVGIEILMRHAAAVGLVLRADMLPIGAPIRDVGQLKVVNRLEPHVRAPFRWVLELPVAPRDLRAFDAGALKPGCRIGFDVWSRVRDVQAQAREPAQATGRGHRPADPGFRRYVEQSPRGPRGRCRLGSCLSVEQPAGPGSLARWSRSGRQRTCVYLRRLNWRAPPASPAATFAWGARTGRDQSDSRAHNRPFGSIPVHRTHRLAPKGAFRLQFVHPTQDRWRGAPKTRGSPPVRAPRARPMDEREPPATQTGCGPTHPRVPWRAA
jgi:transcriptional regulator with XRE-family HTH domain